MVKMERIFCWHVRDPKSPMIGTLGSRKIPQSPAWICILVGIVSMVFKNNGWSPAINKLRFVEFRLYPQAFWEAANLQPFHAPPLREAFPGPGSRDSMKTLRR